MYISWSSKHVDLSSCMISFWVLKSCYLILSICYFVAWCWEGWSTREDTTAPGNFHGSFRVCKSIAKKWRWCKQGECQILDRYVCDIHNVHLIIIILLTISLLLLANWYHRNNHLVSIDMRKPYVGLRLYVWYVGKQVWVWIGDLNEDLIKFRNSYQLLKDFPWLDEYKNLI